MKNGTIAGISTGFAQLDDQLCKSQSSDFILVAGRPCMGKTAFALDIAKHMAFDQKKSVVIFSMEHSKDQLIDRLLLSGTEVDLEHTKLIIDDTPNINISELEIRCRKYKKQNDPQLIIIDYLQLIGGMGNISFKAGMQEISEISRSLKKLARELNVPLLVLSQIGRELEQRSDKRPALSDLNENDIDQAADVIMLIYRDDYYNYVPNDRCVAEIIIAKNNNGPTGTVKLSWFPK